MAIPYARYITGTDNMDYVNVDFSLMNPDRYRSKYRNNIRCPNPACPAELIYSPLKQESKMTPCLKSKALADHIEGCHFKTESKIRDLSKLPQEELIIQFPDPRIIRSLEYAFKTYFLGEIPPTSGPNRHLRGLRYNIKFYKTSEIFKAIDRGYASVGGVVRKIDPFYSDPNNKHVYINFKEDVEQVSILFDRKFHRKYPAIEADINKLILAKQKADANNLDLICIAFGRVVPAWTERGIRIFPFSLRSLHSEILPKH